MLGLTAPAFAQQKETFKEHLQNHYKVYGFIRNYFAYDNREGVAGTGDLFYWSPKNNSKSLVYDNEGNVVDDKTLVNQFRFLSLTSRVGLDVSGYKIAGMEFGAKIEADFYAGLTGSTGTAQLRLRQAFATIKWAEIGPKNNMSAGMKIGQAWHPLAADMPDIYSLETGAPFGPFSRTPLVQADYFFGKHFSLTGATIWQMQYSSAGPDGISANYIKYGCLPEFYIGLNYSNAGFTGRIGYDVLSIKPRNFVGDIRVKDRMTASLGFVYLQYKKDKLSLKAKTLLGQAGEHLGLMSGYTDFIENPIENPTKHTYAPLNTSSTWMSVSYGKKLVGSLFLGYIKQLGTFKELPVLPIIGTAEYLVYMNKNGVTAAGEGSSINSMFRVEPELTYNIGKFTIGIEYMLTGAQFGEQVIGSNDNPDTVLAGIRKGLYLGNLHWVMNHRIQAMVKFTF